MEILSLFASKIVDYTMAPIGRHVGNLFSYKNNFKELIDQVKELEIAREDIKLMVEDEERTGKKIVVDVKNWLDKVDEIIDEVKQLREDPRHEMVGCNKYPFANLRQQHQLSRKAKKMTNHVVVVKAEGKFERDRIGYLPILSGVGSTSATDRFINFESRMSIMDEIMQTLVDPKISILGVYGFGGVGKSTLVEQVARKAKFHIFDEVVMASVTRSPDLKRIQGEIADQLGMKFFEETVAGRAYRLRERINKGKNTLIILDDIWETIKLEDIGIPYRGNINLEDIGIPYEGNINLEERKLSSRDDYKGCKILITTRNEDLLLQMESQKNFRLKVLSEKEAWKLFEAIVGDIANNSTYKGIATEVAKKCAGLPVLIVTVARALKNKVILDWKNALSKLARADIEELHEITYSAWEWSYDQLEGDDGEDIFERDKIGYDPALGRVGSMSKGETLSVIQKLIERGEEGDEAYEIIRRGSLHVVTHPVGLIYRVKKVISLLNLQSSDEVNVVGICGIHGIGKSVIARAVYNLIANLFPGSCFLPDVRENEIRHGLVYIQETFLSEIIRKKDIKLGHVNKGISIIQN